ncbi:MAG: hypothetical protein NZM12_11540, partial [Steroidobacteraceae bacterium]|nr:hypothetical protein [Steroidobacteraceae bacterium]
VNGTNNPKAIPGAVVEYTVTIANSGGAAASGVQIADAIPANTTFADDAYGANADVQIVHNSVTTTCNAEQNGNAAGDGCYLTGGLNSELRIEGTAIPTLTPSGAASSVVVRFRVTIN